MIGTFFFLLLSNILEKLFFPKLDNFINAKDILNSSQCGFRKAMSTSHAVMELIQDISNATDKKNHAIGVFIDLKRPSIQWTTKYFSNI